MAILRDFCCPEHGVFESFEETPDCPMKQCQYVPQRVFLKAPGIKSEGTKKIERTQKSLALDFGMSDIKSTREGEHQTGFLKKGTDTRAMEQAAAEMQGRREPRPGDAVLWGGGGRFSMGQALAGQLARPVRDERVGVSTQGALPQVKPSVVLNDHENLKLPG